jgi:hypothetical protein
MVEWHGERSLVAFGLDDDVGDFLRVIEEELVRSFRWNANEIAGGDFLAESALDCAVALFVRGDRFGIDESTTDNESGGARLDKDDIDLRFVPLRSAIGFATNEHGGLVGKIGELLDGEMMGIGCRL